MRRNVPSSRRSSRSALPRRETVRAPVDVLTDSSPLTLYSSNRSTTATGRSASIRKTASPSPEAAGEPSSRVLSRPASASENVASSSCRSTIVSNMRRASSRLSGVIAPRPRFLPGAEEVLEHGMDELTLAAGVHHFLVFGLLFERQDVAGEELERAFEVGFDAAHRPDARRPGARYAVELGTIRRRTTHPQRRPLTRLLSEMLQVRQFFHERIVVKDQIVRPMPSSATVESRARAISSSSDDRDTMASSSSVIVESATERDAEPRRSRKRASAAARRSFSDGHPSAFNSRGG